MSEWAYIPIGTKKSNQGMFQHNIENVENKMLKCLHINSSSAKIWTEETGCAKEFFCKRNVWWDFVNKDYVMVCI